MAPKPRRSLARAAGARAEAPSVTSSDVELPANTLASHSSGEDSAFSGPDELHMRNEIQKILEEFQEDFKRFLHEKGQRATMNISASVNAIQQDIEHALKDQYEERKMIYQEYCTELASLILMWNIDVKKVKEQREKLTNIIQRQGKAYHEAHAAHCEKMKTFSELLNQYMKRIEELDNYHGHVLTGEESVLRRQMAILQERLTMEVRQAEMDSIRAYLLSLLL